MDVSAAYQIPWHSTGCLESSPSIFTLAFTIQLLPVEVCKGLPIIRLYLFTFQHEVMVHMKNARKRKIMFSGFLISVASEIASEMSKV